MYLEYKWVRQLHIFASKLISMLATLDIFLEKIETFKHLQERKLIYLYYITNNLVIFVKNIT